MEKDQDMPEIGSLWIDEDEGLDCIYRYQGIDKSEFGSNRLHFVRYDWQTKTASTGGGGTWVGKNRFKSDFIPIATAETKPCCGRPTAYSLVWCDDCGYETWSKARDEKEAA